MPYTKDAFLWDKPDSIINRLEEINTYTHVSKNSFPEVTAGCQYLFEKAKAGQKPNLFNFINIYIFILYYNYLPSLGFKGIELKNMIVAILMYHPMWYKELILKQIVLINEIKIDGRTLPIIDIPNILSLDNKILEPPYFEDEFIISNYIQYICLTLDLYKELIESGELKEADRVKWFDEQAEYLEKELNIPTPD